MKALNFLIIKLTLCLILGIALSHVVRIDVKFSLCAFSVVFLGLLIGYFVALRQFKKTIWFGLFAYLTTVSLGNLSYCFHQQQNFRNHYSHFISENNNNQELLKFRIKERLKPSRFHNKYIVQLIAKDNHYVIGKLLLNVEKDSTLPMFKVDDVMVGVSQLIKINKPLNPNQFDYSAYLEKQSIFHQVFVQQTSLLRLQTKTNSLLGYAEKLRHRINTKLKLYNFKSDELAIINALLLGQRQDMSKDIYDNYVNAGAIHILAVSGLHVGIILMILNFCLQPIELIKYGKPIKVCLLLLILWSFAIVAGLSASVTRAVTMFSIVAIALNWRRPTNIYNTLAISVFILLLFKPMFLFDVGFQMSYMAVLAIVTIQPIIYKLWRRKWRLFDYFWQILTVTIAAQFGVIPISLYYFHQFPGLFFVSNLIIIPFLGLILGFGILVIVLALLNGLPELIANGYGKIIRLMNSIVSWLSEQDAFLFRHISFDIEHVVVCYLLLVSSIVLFKKRSFHTLSFFLISILFAQGVWFYSKYKRANSEFVIFHKSRYSLLGQRSNSKLRTFHNFDSMISESDQIIDKYRVGNFITDFSEDSLQSVYRFRNKTFLIVDSLGVYNVKSFRPNYIILRNSPRINLERLIDSLNPQLIIADGSNYKSYVARWETTCVIRKLPFHHTGKKGAFILKNKSYSDSLNSGLNAR